MLRIDEEKNAFRKNVKSLLKTLSLEEKENQSKKIFSLLTSKDFYKKANLIFSYFSLDSEVNTLTLFKKTFLDGKKILLPKVCHSPLCQTKNEVCQSVSAFNEQPLNEKKSSQMEFYFIDNSKEDFFQTQMEKGAFGILEPKKNLKVFDMTSSFFCENDFSFVKNILVLVPGLAFSKDKKRLGHGKGFYDIYLSRLSSFCKENKISLTCAGLSFDIQLFEKIPFEKNDFTLDHILSPSFFI